MGSALKRDSLIGHAGAVRFLTELARRQRVPAAVLFSGPPNVGKRTITHMLAATLLGSTDTAELARHPDVLFVECADEGGQRTAVFDHLARVHERPFTAAFRVVILDSVDRASDPASALLLKTIEDAPSFVRLLLTAVTPQRVPATVRSRCLVRELPPVPDRDMLHGLSKQGVPSEIVEEVVSLAGGRPGLALRLAADGAVLDRYRSWNTITQGPTPGPRPGVQSASRSGLWGCQRTSVRSRSEFAQSIGTAEAAEEFLVFLQGRLRRGTPSPRLLRRSREGVAMVRQHVPPGLVVEYVLGGV